MKLGPRVASLIAGMLIFVSPMNMMSASCSTSSAGIGMKVDVASAICGAALTLM